MSAAVLSNTYRSKQPPVYRSVTTDGRFIYGLYVDGESARHVDLAAEAASMDVFGVQPG